MKIYDELWPQPEGLVITQDDNVTFSPCRAARAQIAAICALADEVRELRVAYQKGPLYPAGSTIKFDLTNTSGVTPPIPVHTCKCRVSNPEVGYKFQCPECETTWELGWSNKWWADRATDGYPATQKPDTEQSTPQPQPLPLS